MYLGKSKYLKQYTIYVPTSENVNSYFNIFCVVGMSRSIS